MLEWLSGWLKDIITVILLAAIVDLLLPNKAMQRYARLVVGLIVLITILSPLIRLFQGDFNQRVEDGMTAWERASASRSVEMPTLQQITKDAEQLQTDRQRQAAALAERQLAAAMSKQIDKKLGIEGTLANVKLASGEDGIEQVIVTLSSTPQAAEERTEAPQPDSEEKRSGDEVKPVQPVDIAVSTDMESIGATTDAGKQQSEVEQDPVKPEWRAAVSDVLRQGWGVSPSQIEVRMNR
ncbi:stage III sporulation protein AF [Paenibacillus curdlanolyticus YK9]|uniref:Stage III sporulation protein AF n=1 Tax=Paenibacillus curdlanolyticus YK9 TaxID=717606 RepID=E0ICJ5_9BACL|nr:stage III sporulation protein AF [Paenibacillus curdlanolyticus]EFM09881.1 stage III sporulation protein AF [Paenibacillus curdlanolyticus YK9]